MNWTFRDVGPDDGRAVESLLETSDDYMIKTTGLFAAGADAQGQFYEGLQYPGTEKRLVGAFAPDGHLTVLIDMLLGYPERDSLAVALLYVDPRERSKGAGKQALMHVEQIASQAGVRQLRMDNVPSGEPVAAHLLSSSGWWPRTREDPDATEAGGGLAISWYKKLDPPDKGRDNVTPRIRHLLSHPAVRVRKIEHYYEDELCDAYEATMEARYAGECWDTQPILEEVEGANQVYEIGSGSGRLMRDLLSNFPQLEYRGVDISKPALVRARNRARKLGLESQVELIVEDVREPVGVFADADVTLVADCTINCFENSRELEALITHLKTAVKPRAKLIISMFDDAVLEMLDDLHDHSVMECLPDDTAGPAIVLTSVEYDTETRLLRRNVCFLRTERTQVQAAIAVLRDRLWTPNEVIPALTNDEAFVLKKRIPVSLSNNAAASSGLPAVTLVLERSDSKKE